SLSVSITDKNGRRVSRSDTLSVCSAPYRVTLSSTGGSLTTLYGVPNSSTFSGSSVVYYINPNSQQPGVCYARPNRYLGGNTGNRFVNDIDHFTYVGPADIWDPDKGFLVQSTNWSSYRLNFPTTGADGLYFDLDISGVDASQLTWSVVTRGAIRATVSWTRPRSDSHRDPIWGTVQHDSWISDKSKNVTRVTLNGPRADSTRIQSSNPSPLIVPSLPQTFVLVGSDRSGNEVRYGFVLKQWFVHRGDKEGTLYEQSSWCSGLGYRTSQVKDLTNASGGYWQGAMPSSGFAGYQRRIGAGFFTEWGYIPHYASTGFLADSFWTGDHILNLGFTVYPASGDVGGYDVFRHHYGLCTVP
ncbi:hypothetical protein GA0061081_1021, partial [Gilliamella bombicola]